MTESKNECNDEQNGSADPIELAKEKGVEWPPPYWRDTFQPPAFECIKLRNFVADMVSSIDMSDAQARAMLHRINKQSLPVVFFAANEHVKFDDGKWDPQDWQLYPAPDLPGVCMAVYVHKTTVQVLQTIVDMHPSGPGAADNRIALMWHAVPVQDAPGVYSPIEAYVLVGSQTMALQPNKLAPQCTHCGLQSQFACRCERAHFCSLHCESAARQFGTHSAAMCASLYLRRIAGMTEEARQNIMQQAKEETDRNAAEVREAQERYADPEKAEEAEKAETEERKQHMRILAQLARIEDGLEADPKLPDVSDIVESAQKDGFWIPKSMEPAAPAPPNE